MAERIGRIQFNPVILSKFWSDVRRRKWFVIVDRFESAVRHMKILQFDSVGGASGDMILASLVSLGADLGRIRKHIESLNIEKVTITADQVNEDGFAGIRVNVDVVEHQHDDHHHARRLSDITSLIRQSSFAEDVKELSIAVFTKLAFAESEVHGVAPDKIHFHEVGAGDSIVEIVASCAALKELGVTAVAVSPLPLASGTVECAHGVMPIPAPATVILLKGHPMAATDETSELVTPTGAALLMTWKELMTCSAAMTLNMVKAGHGFGHRRLKGRPNMLRAMLLEKAVESGGQEQDSCLVLECNLDDTVPELLGSLTQKLMDTGALDVFTTAIQMKKQRPGTLLTVLCKPVDRERFLDLIFKESTTFGVREHLTKRAVLERRHVEVATPYGTVRIKIGTWKGVDITRAPEHEDCQRLAREKGVSVRIVYEAAVQAAGRVAQV